MDSGDVLGHGNEGGTRGTVDAIGGQAAGAGEDTLQSQEEEVEPANIVPNPYVPTQSEIDDHCVDHLPYRSWCKFCIEAFGREDAHVSSESEHTVPIVSMDYMVVSQRGCSSARNGCPRKGESFLKVLVAKDSRSKCVFAHAVPVKGVDGNRYVIDCVVQDCSWLG